MIAVGKGVNPKTRELDQIRYKQTKRVVGCCWSVSAVAWWLGTHDHDDKLLLLTDDNGLSTLTLRSTFSSASTVICLFTTT